MRRRGWFMIFMFLVFWQISARAEDWTGRVKKAVERSTLDQPGAKPFHLKATIAPSFERDKASGRTGEVEVWWASPTQWKREVRSPEFHQVEVVNDGHDWQKNEGEYFPEWLRVTAVELIRPIPPIDDVLAHVKAAEARNIFGRQINIDWITNTGTAEVHNIRRSWVALNGTTGDLLYAGGFGWGGEFKDYQSFHGRIVARTVNVGSPQVTAKIFTLEDLGDVPNGFFDASAQGGDLHPLQTLLIDEISLRKNLQPAEPAPWPPLQDGPLEGNVTTEILVDREGKVREFGVFVSENSAINEAGRQRILAMQFKPFLQDGVPVQVVSQITVPFKTVRLAGTETFDSARTYFERGRRVSFPAAGAGSPYILHAEFEAITKTGTATGRYEDTWLGETQWRREAWFGDSHYVRSRNGEKLYQFGEGDQIGLLQFLFRVVEPIPATDTFQEGDWRIKRDAVDNVRAVRVLAGYESPEGKLDPEQARGYWFDDSGLLLKTFFDGLETRRSAFQEFAGIRLAHRIDVLKDGHLTMGIRVTEVAPPSGMKADILDLKGHPWERAFTSEVR
jgi:hypothetical protein